MLILESKTSRIEPPNSLNERPFEWSSDLPLKMKDDSALMIARKEAATRKRQLKKRQKEAASCVGILSDMITEEGDVSEDEEFETVV